MTLRYLTSTILSTFGAYLRNMRLSCRRRHHNAWSIPRNPGLGASDLQNAPEAPALIRPSLRNPSGFKLLLAPL